MMRFILLAWVLIAVAYWTSHGCSSLEGAVVTPCDLRVKQLERDNRLLRRDLDRIYSELNGGG